MMTVSAPWYESGTFWTVFVGAIVAVGVGIFAAYSNYRIVNPKCLFTYCLRKNTSLLNASGQVSGTLSVAHGTTRLSRPRVVEIEVKNEGRRAVTAQDFHGGDSIEFEVGAPIIALLESDTVPSHSRVPNSSLAGSVLRIEPSLLSSKQSTSFTLLVDGPRAELQCRSSLVDVPVKERKPESPLTAAQARFAKGALRASVVMTVVCFLILGYVFSVMSKAEDSLDDSKKVLKDAKAVYEDAQAVHDEAKKLAQEVVGEKRR
ncbi:hypothetical protein [Streptomyces sp. RK9]|uniref:hypothetical protein n=1 Tax=Streptomyces sp. RK9 TaxID=3239284 RepID=UPI00386DF2CE